MPGYPVERDLIKLTGRQRKRFYDGQRRKRLRNAAEGGAVVYAGTCVGERRVRVRRSERVVLECDCGERLVLTGPVVVRRSGRVLECDCGERFTLAGRLAVREPEVVAHGYKVRSPEEERRYSWLEDCLEWLEGKEARQEYYARLERVS